MVSLINPVDIDRRLFSHTITFNQAQATMGSPSDANSERPFIAIANWSDKYRGLAFSIFEKSRILPVPRDGGAPEATTADVRFELIGRFNAEKTRGLSNYGRGEIDFRYHEQEVESKDRYVRLLKDEVRIHEAQYVLVLPDLKHGEPDSFSCYVCELVSRACRGNAAPRIVVYVLDLESTFEFERFGVTCLIHPETLTAQLVAMAAIDRVAHRFVDTLLTERYWFKRVPCPEVWIGSTTKEIRLHTASIAQDERAALIGIMSSDPSQGSQFSPPPHQRIGPDDELLFLVAHAPHAPIHGKNK